MTSVPLTDDDRLVRRVLDRHDFLVWHADEGRWIPSLAGIKFDPDGMSTFVLRLLMLRCHGAKEVASFAGTKSEELAFEVLGAEALRLGFETKHSPDTSTPIGYAHSSVVRPDGLDKSEWRALRSDLARAFECVYGTPSLEPPPT